MPTSDSAPTPAAASDAAAAPAETQPGKEQLQFARAAHIVLELWPVLRRALQEEWGGPESMEKRDFLLSFLCDEYGDGGAKTLPDADDVEEIVANYMGDEFGCQLEDESARWVASHICLAHKNIFIQNNGDKYLAALELGVGSVRGKAAPAQVDAQYEDGVRDADFSSDEAPPATEQRGGEAVAAPRERAAPEIDDDGFETVAPRRRR
ncbi:rRNA accumulation- protein [Malassezia sp. CBS 17886]|nr:rRNA accumulation- protein [Malassezia sp. CBS 17886]